VNDGAVWDGRKAASLDGALVLVGITQIGPEDTEQSQFYGTVIEVSQQDGVLMWLEGKRAGETFRLPPDLDAFEPAPPGEYRLRTTGETVSDPDYTTSWTITPPAN